MKYYKWVESNEDKINIIPLYVYTSIEEAYKYKEKDKTLYSFDGVEPVTVKQKLPPIGLLSSQYQQNIMPNQLVEALTYFGQKDENCLIGNSIDLIFMKSIAYSVVCIKNQNTAFYTRPAELTKEDIFIITQTKGTPPDCTCIPPATIFLTMSGCTGWEVTNYALAESGGIWYAYNPSSLVDIFSLQCIGSQWTATIQPTAAECLVDSTTAVSGSCSPFSLSFSLPITGDCCGAGSTTITFTVQE